MVSETQQWVNFGVFVAGGAAITTLIIGDIIKRLWLRILTATSASVAFCYAALRTLPLTDWILGLVQFPLILALLTIFLGVVAHAFRKTNKLRYGQVEVLFGMVSAVSIAFATGQTVFARTVSLAAAAYVVASGLNNWDEQLVEHGDKRGNRSIWQQVRTMMFEEVESGQRTTGCALAAPRVGALPDLDNDPQKQEKEQKR